MQTLEISMSDGDVVTASRSGDSFVETHQAVPFVFITSSVFYRSSQTRVRAVFCDSSCVNHFPACRFRRYPWKTRTRIVDKASNV
jgi:hypothetical protein